jgi:ABC-type spermidine/putrescine transport system permease subunit I
MSAEASNREPTLLELIVALLLIGVAGYVATTAVTGFNFVNNMLSTELQNYAPGSIIQDPYPYFVTVGGIVATVLVLLIAFKVAYALRRGG